MKWRSIVIGVIVFVLGVGAGVVLEHEKVKHDSENAGWFDGHAAAACPALRRWDASVAAARQTLSESSPWASSQATLSAQMTESSTALQSLLAFSTYKGQAGLNFLVSVETKKQAAAQKATSAAGFSDVQKQLTTPRVTKDVATLTRVENGCSKE